MRKFNLKGTVIQRMRGIERETPKAPENEKEQVQVNTEMSAGFTSAQGQLRYAWSVDSIVVRHKYFQHFVSVSFLAILFSFSHCLRAFLLLPSSDTPCIIIAISFICQAQRVSFNPAALVIHF